MKVTGIIAEYNPFHNGHFYHLRTAKQQTNADYMVVVMSGNFTQRGIPALLSKYERAKHALLAGADLVLDLPMPYATSSAEYFAKGSCALLDRLGVVDTLSFGMEQDNLSDLQTLASIIATEPALYQSLLREKLSLGLSFPKAQQEALAAYDGNLNLSLLSAPNNRLGLEYLKALQQLGSSISPVPIKRMGKGYDDPVLSLDGESEFSSASAIRSCISETAGKEKSNLLSLKNHVPDFEWESLQSLLYNKQYLLVQDLDLLLHYKLLQQSVDSLQTFVDINEDMANKIMKLLPDYTGFEQFCMALKSKDLTYTRISRMLLHVLLDLKETDMDTLGHLQHAPYGRILGFKKEAVPLLHEIKEKSTLPLISKLADAHKILSSDALSILEKDIATSHIYEAILSKKANKPLENEYTRQIIIL